MNFSIEQDQTRGRIFRFDLDSSQPQNPLVVDLHRGQSYLFYRNGAYQQVGQQSGMLFDGVEVLVRVDSDVHFDIIPSPQYPLRGAFSKHAGNATSFSFPLGALYIVVCGNGKSEINAALYRFRSSRRGVLKLSELLTPP